MKYVRIDRIKLTTELARRDMTQKQLAELTGVSRATINYVKNGKRCTDEIGGKIAQALGVDLKELIESQEV